MVSLYQLPGLKQNRLPYIDGYIRRKYQIGDKFQLIQLYWLFTILQVDLQRIIKLSVEYSTPLMSNGRGLRPFKRNRDAVGDINSLDLDQEEVLWKSTVLRTPRSTENIVTMLHHSLFSSQSMKHAALLQWAYDLLLAIQYLIHLNWADLKCMILSWWLLYWLSKIKSFLTH